MSTDTHRPATDSETGAHLSGHRLIEGAVETEHGLLVPVTEPIVLVIEIHYLEDDVHDGDRPTDDTRIKAYDCNDEPVDDAVQALEVEGLSFATTGTHWAANPDGSRIADYATGERVETSAHLYGFSDDDLAAIIAAVE